MDIFEPLKKLLKEKLADVEFHIDEPANSASVWWLDVRWQNHSLVVQWNFNYQRFGVSFDPDPDYFTHQPDHLFKTEAEVADWVMKQLGQS